MVNVTLTTDPELLAKAQAYAQARNTTLDQLVCDYLERLTEQIEPSQAAEEFAALARNHAGRSDPGFQFDRCAAHQRSEDQPQCANDSSTQT